MRNYLKQKNQILEDKLKSKDKSSYSNALCFAIKNDIFPICDLNYESFLVLENDFSINKNTMSDIYIKLQNSYDKKEKVSFDQVEFLSDTWGINEMKKIDILRYFYLSNKFQNNDKGYDFWTNLFENQSYDESMYCSNIVKDFSYHELTDEIRI